MDVEVRMEDGTWEPGVIVQESESYPGAALVTWKGITAWLYRQRGRGRPDEWREPASDEGRMYPNAESAHAHGGPWPNPGKRAFDEGELDAR